MHSRMPVRAYSNPSHSNLNGIVVPLSIKTTVNMAYYYYSPCRAILFRPLIADLNFTKSHLHTSIQYSMSMRLHPSILDAGTNGTTSSSSTQDPLSYGGNK